MQFFRGRQGGMVSVFLMMILVPLMAFSTVCVEALHYRSTVGIYEESMDLSANSVLSDYDKLLFQEYGLLAIKQSGKEQETFLSYLHDNVEGGQMAKEVNLVVPVSDSDLKSFVLADPLSKPEILKKQMARYEYHREKGDTQEDYEKICRLKATLQDKEGFLETRIWEMEDCSTLLENILIYRNGADFIRYLAGLRKDSEEDYEDSFIAREWDICRNDEWTSDDIDCDGSEEVYESSIEEEFYAIYYMMVIEDCYRYAVADLGDTFIDYCSTKLTRQEYPIFVKAMWQGSNDTHQDCDFDVSGIPKKKNRAAVLASLEAKRTSLKNTLKESMYDNLWNRPGDYVGEDVWEILSESDIWYGVKDIDEERMWLIDSLYNNEQHQISDDMMYRNLYDQLGLMLKQAISGKKSAQAFMEGWQTGKKKEWKKQAVKASDDVIDHFQDVSYNTIRQLLKEGAKLSRHLLQHYKRLKESTGRFQNLGIEAEAFGTTLHGDFDPDYFGLNGTKSYLEQVQQQWDETNPKLKQKIKSQELQDFYNAVDSSVKYLEQAVTMFTEFDLKEEIGGLASEFAETLESFVYDGKYVYEYKGSKYPEITDPDNEEEESSFYGINLLKRIIQGRNRQSEWKDLGPLDTAVNDINNSIYMFLSDNDIVRIATERKRLEEECEINSSDLLQLGVKELQVQGNQETDISVPETYGSGNLTQRARYAYDGIWRTRHAQLDIPDKRSLESTYLFSVSMLEGLKGVRGWYKKFQSELPQEAAGTWCTEDAYVIRYLRRFTTMMHVGDDGSRRMEREFLITGSTDPEKTVLSLAWQNFCLNFMLHLGEGSLKAAMNSTDRKGSFFGKKYMHVFWVASEKSEEDGDRLGDTAALPLLYEMGYWAKIADRLFGNGNSISDWNFGIQNYQQALDALIWGVDVNTLAKRAGMVIEERMRKLDPGFSLANRPTRVKAEVAGTWKNFIPLPSMVSDQPVVEKAMPTITVERSY